MKLSLLLIAFIAICLINDSDAGFFRRLARKAGRAIKKVGGFIKEAGCAACPRVCRIEGICSVVCRRVCRGKRAAVMAEENHVTPLANQLSAYDINDDGMISRKELAMAIGEDEAHHDFLLAYKIADVNGDGILTPKEFYNGPFVFEMDVNDDDLQYCRYRLDIDDDLVDIVDGNEIAQGQSFIAGESVKETGKPGKETGKRQKITKVL
ncbi:EF-hand calcium-binding domain-containing protein 1-like [Patella vulgata]|uniref:EF-hand calcium-binding domain-containing protein 1-like n=1 Tax=Patella vulgata TaxID=6465 RepID=UPI0024A8A087|nr:EF-hand calcium-binding domain-containing protein 1-like [Patella vulgata]